MQYADTASVYACPVCGSRYWEDCIAGCTLYMEREYTDGTVIYNIPRMPWLTQCPRCGSLFDRKFLVFQENFPDAYPHLYRGWEEAEQKPASLTPDASLWEAAYKKGLYFPPSVGEAERKEYGEKVLVSLWRAYHWPKDGKVQISRRGYEEFTRHLLRTLPPIKKRTYSFLRKQTGMPESKSGAAIRPPRCFVVAETFCYSASSLRISSRPSPRKTPAFFAFSSSYAGAPAYPFSLS